LQTRPTLQALNPPTTSLNLVPLGFAPDESALTRPLGRFNQPKAEFNEAQHHSKFPALISQVFRFYKSSSSIGMSFISALCNPIFKLLFPWIGMTTRSILPSLAPPTKV